MLQVFLKTLMRYICVYIFSLVLPRYGNYYVMCLKLYVMIYYMSQYINYIGESLKLIQTHDEESEQSLLTNGEMRWSDVQMYSSFTFLS